MFPVKKNILQTVSLLKAYDVRHIVLSSGSRNAPLIQAFTQEKYFDCHLVVDERNAAFYALGIIQCKKEPVAICCTSGTAVLDYAPAIAEAFYQQLPLIVITADRATGWVDQMDGQTIRQPNIYKDYIKKAVNLPEIASETDEWYCNRIINEALIACTANEMGPVHINIPLSEPLFDYSIKKLPEVRKIRYARPYKNIDIQPYADIWNNTSKKTIVVGQLPPNPLLADLLKQLSEKSGCVILSEHLGNCNYPEFIHNFDSVLQEPVQELAPELLISFGGHIVSKRLKKFLREYKPKHHWLISQNENIADLFQSLTDLIEADKIPFFSNLLNKNKYTNTAFKDYWINYSQAKCGNFGELPFSDIYACKKVAAKLPDGSKLLLANSSSLRNVQHFELNPSIEIYCNRGTNGIEGSLPTAIGFAAVSENPVYFITGDLSFFCAVNALWNIKQIKNLRILLLNNKGGNIFHTIPGLNISDSLPDYVAAAHDTTAKKWVEASGFTYMKAANKEELDEKIKIFMNEDIKNSLVLEVLTDIEVNQSIIKKYKL